MSPRAYGSMNTIPSQSVHLPVIVMVRQFVLRTSLLSAFVAGGISLALASANPELEAHQPSQAAADAFRELAGTDMAFIAAGMVRPLETVSDLSVLLVYPTDTLSVLQLSGAQVRQALERSVSLLPLPSSSFLQISGVEVTYSRGAPADKRVTLATVNGVRLNESERYTVAVPTTLARGGLGYFKVWQRDDIQRTIEGQTLESILKGKPFKSTPSRWTAQ